MFLKNNISSFYSKKIIPIFLIIYGMIASYREAFSLWRVDADTAVFPAMIRYFWEGGWDAIKTFHFPIDNWFFQSSFRMVLYFISLESNQQFLLC
ncbi:hypothetical protein BG621_03440 [Parasaccharibacter apium]|nr:hypothetical protein BG621_03440 [Parasaccharibacter apium]